MHYIVSFLLITGDILSHQLPVINAQIVYNVMALPVVQHCKNELCFLKLLVHGIHLLCKGMRFVHKFHCQPHTLWELWKTFTEFVFVVMTQLLLLATMQYQTKTWNICVCVYVCIHHWSISISEPLKQFNCKSAWHQRESDEFPAGF